MLEPWITPSLFYQFLEKNQKDGVGMDSYSFCEALGPEEGNRWMKGHWENWMSSDYMDELAKRKVERIRLPIGDWSIN